jgi:hypothetical protein
MKDEHLYINKFTLFASFIFVKGLFLSDFECSLTKIKMFIHIDVKCLSTKSDDLNDNG